MLYFTFCQSNYQSVNKHHQDSSKAAKVSAVASLPHNDENKLSFIALMENI